MSHFCVLVVGQNIDEQLAPFNEQPEEGSEYLEFEDNTEEWQKEYETKSTECHKVGKEYVFTWKYEQGVKDGKYKEGIPKKEVPFKTIYSTFEDFCKDWHGISKSEDGRWGYWCNPNAKWDWYQVGGRWSGFFWKKPDAKSGKVGEKSWTNEKDEFNPLQVDVIRKRDVDVNAMRNHDIMQWKSTYKAAMKMTETGPREFIYGVKAGETEQDFINRKKKQHPCETFAVLYNGEWIEQGSMGWFGVVRDEKDDNTWTTMFQEIWDHIPDTATLSIVDCHI